MVVMVGRPVLVVVVAYANAFDYFVDVMSTCFWVVDIHVGFSCICTAPPTVSI